jgi:hypothetical protein
MEWEVVEARGRGGGGRQWSTVVVMHTCERKSKLNFRVVTMPKCQKSTMGVIQTGANYLMWALQAPISVAVARIFHFCKSNKIDKILKIFEHIDLPNSQWVLCKH